MNFKLKTLIAAAAMLAGSALATTVSAAVPNLTVNYTGTQVNSGQNQVVVTVTNGNPYSQVSLYYSQSSSYYNAATALGETDVTGYMSATTYIPNNGTNSPILYYVVVGGIQSNTVSLAPQNSSGSCYYVNGVYTCGGTGSLSVSQTSVTMNIGQTLSLNIYGSSGSAGYSYGSSPYYIVSNVPSGIVTAGVNGSTLSLLAIGSGQATVQVCPLGGSAGNSSCASVIVTSNFNGYSGTGNGTVTLSQSSLDLSYIGQNSVVQVYSNGSYGGYITVNNNSNPAVASATISGSSLNVVATGIGNATLTVCNQNGYASASGCASLYITVNSASTGSCYYVGSVYTCPGSSNCYNNGYSTNCVGQANALTFSNQSATMSVGQSAAIVIYGNGVYNSYSYNNYQSYQVTGNSNSGVVSASTSGNSLNLVGLANGSSAVSVCSLYGAVVGTNGTSCGTVYVTVIGNNVTTSTGSCYYVGSVYTCPGQVLGASTYANGRLVQEGSTVYIYYRNTLTAFGNYGAFVGFGFRSQNVVNAGYTNIPISGYVISTQFAPHPWGTWVKSGQAIYFVSEYGLIPVPDYGTFLNNGGNSANVVTANAYDFQLPLQSPMTSQDSRLSE